MVKIIFRTSQVSIKMACTLFSIYHNTITHKRQSDNFGFIRWICNWENTLSCVTTNTKSLNNKSKTHKHIIHGKQNILVKCKLGSGREIGANDNTDKKMNMAYPDQVYVASHWGRVMHICVSNLTIIDSDNGLLPGWRQAIIWTNARILFIGPLGTNFSEILIGIHTFSFKKIHLKMSSAEWRPFCLDLNVLIIALLPTQMDHCDNNPCGGYTVHLNY